MTDRMDTEALRALTELRSKVTDEDLHESGRYFYDSSFRDLTRCSHGDTGNFSVDADGKAIALLWNLWRSGAIEQLGAERYALMGELIEARECIILLENEQERAEKAEARLAEVAVDRDRWKAMAGELSEYHSAKLAEAKSEAGRYRAEGDSESAATCLHEAILHSEALNAIRSLSPEEIMKKEGL